MGFFGKKKKEEDKKVDDKPAKAISEGKKYQSKADKTEEKKESMKELYDGEKISKTKQTKDKKETKVKKHGNAYKILVKPLITEKAADLGKYNQYVFAVAPRSNKIEIARAINEVYGVKPIAINIIKIMGKKTRYGRITGKRKDWKKAIITLPAGKTIKIYEGV